MAVVEAPQPVVSPPPARGGAVATASAPGGPTPAWLARVASPAIVVLVAGLVVLASGWGNEIAGLTRTEIATMLGGGALVLAALLRAPDARVPGGWSLAAFTALAALTGLSILWAADPNGAWIEANRTVAYAFAFAGAAALAVV